MTMLGRGKKKAAKVEDAKDAVEAPEDAVTSSDEPSESVSEAVSEAEDSVEPQKAAESPSAKSSPEDAAEDSAEPEDATEGADEDIDDEAPADSGEADEAQARLIAAKADLAKAEAELAKARLAEAEAELARAEKAAKARQKARDKGKAPSYSVTTIEPGPAPKDDVQAEPRQPRQPVGALTQIVIVAGLGVLTAALIATCVLLSLKKQDQDATDTASREALTAAAAAAQDFSSYDYRSLDSNFKTGMNEATGQWLRNYQQLTEQIRQTAQQTQVVVVGTVLKTGLEQVSANRAVAIVFLNQQTSKAGQDKGYDQYRLRLTMEKHHGHWLVSNLQAL